MECIKQLEAQARKLEQQTKEYFTPTPLTDRIRELGKQEPMQDFDISSIAEKSHDFIHNLIYQYE